tara:strand:- start:704 stop:1318 length:615 start_codon:yes stop_codon:yes gene_type:complete
MGLISNGTTIFDSGSMASGFGGNLNFISKQTASSSSTISFTSGINSTYKEYLFTFKNMHPSADGEDLQFNMSADSGSNYNVTKTTTAFRAFHNEAGNDTNFSYHTGEDLAQGTGFQSIAYETDNANDSGISGSLHLFNPSSTTFVKHFIAQTSSCIDGGATYGIYNLNFFTAGYGNTTSAVDAIQFKMSSGNIDAGDICLYGIA